MQQIALELAEKAAGKKRVCSRPYKSKLPIAGDVFRKENVSCFFICKKRKTLWLANHVDTVDEGLEKIEAVSGKKALLSDRVMLRVATLKICSMQPNSMWCTAVRITAAETAECRPGENPAAGKRSEQSERESE